MMCRPNDRRGLLHIFIFLLFASAPALQGQIDPADVAALQLNRLTSFTALPNGIDLRDGNARMQILALREDVVRIRVSRSDQFAEDASWAVLEQARQNRVAVSPAETAEAVGFQTKVLRLSINRQTFALTISDQQGNIVQQDVRPIEFYGDSFL